MCMAASFPLPISTASDDADRAGTLAEQVRAAAADRAPLRIAGGDTKAFLGRPVRGEALVVAGHRGILSYEPTELVLTARAGTPLVEIDQALAAHGQMLGFEPPLLGEASTLGGAVAAGLSGARRPFAGAVRDFVLGVRILDGRGRDLCFGGTVFKNVAGFDLFRLMAGAHGALGVILEVSLRLLPAPAAETTRILDLGWPQAQARLADLLRRPLPISGAVHADGRLHLRLSGGAAAVGAAASEIGGAEGDPDFWRDLRTMRLPVLTAPRLWRLSVPAAARLDGLDGEWLRDWAGSQRWLVTKAPAEAVRAAARAAGGHVILFRGAAAGEAVFQPLAPPLLALHRRLKAALDPAGILNPGRLYAEL